MKRFPTVSEIIKMEFHLSYQIYKNKNTEISYHGSEVQK